jgi:hypothetical protein
MGERLHATGGLTAMQAAFYVLLNFSPVATNADKMTLGLMRAGIEYTWHGIGSWRR